MPDYQKMYTTLFNAITDALEALEAQNFGDAKKLLCSAQLTAEGMYLAAAGSEDPEKREGAEE